MCRHCVRESNLLLPLFRMMTAHVLLRSICVGPATRSPVERHLQVVCMCIYTEPTFCPCSAFSLHYVKHARYGGRQKFTHSKGSFTAFPSANDEPPENSNVSFCGLSLQDTTMRNSPRRAVHVTTDRVVQWRDEAAVLIHSI